MRYEGAIFRPFSEAASYLLQCTIGCSHNACTFCGMYKDKRFRIRPTREVLEDIRMAKDHLGDVEKVFLCDGDAIVIDTDTLLEILDALYAAFPSLRHVGLYVGPQSTLSKTKDDLARLRAAGLTKAYLGVETGDDALLKAVHKGAGYEEMLQAGLNLLEADINLSVMVLLGLAGRGEASTRHALATARIVNAMKPQYLAALTVTPVPGTPLFTQVQSGRFELPDPFETLVEMKTMLQAVSVDALKFVGTHASNYLPVTGELQKDKPKLIALIDGVLESQDARLLKPEGLRGL